ncbi:MAG: hypothetical protein ACK55S_12535, partial [Planctomycetota bacterium]
NVHTPTFDSLSPADSDPNQGKCLRHHPHVNSPRQSLPLLSLLNPLPAIKSLRCMLRCGSLPHFDPAFRINPVVPTGVVRIHRPQFGPPSSIWTTVLNLDHRDGRSGESMFFTHSMLCCYFD